MRMLSELLRRPISDRQGRSSRLVDLAVDVAAGDYPPVTRILLPGEDGTAHALPASATLDPAGGFVVDTLDAAEPLDDETLAGLILLKRDVQDALVLDLAQERAV